MVEFRGSWDCCRHYPSKRLMVLHLFFRFCVVADWIDKGPVAGLKAPQVDTPPRCRSQTKSCNGSTRLATGTAQTAIMTGTRQRAFKAFVWDATLLRARDQQRNHIRRASSYCQEFLSRHGEDRHTCFHASALFVAVTIRV
jgi:hypothetical protein